MSSQTTTRKARRTRAAVAAPTTSTASTVAPFEVDVNALIRDNVDEAPPAPKKEKAAPLTLSQRRALLRLQQTGVWFPTTGFAALPFEHLADHGLADRVDGGGFRPTEKGRAREINPGYATWSAGETVANDPSRPVAGTTRVEKARAIATA